MRAEVIDTMVATRIPESAFAEQWELAELAEDVRRVFNLDLPIVEWGNEEGDRRGEHPRAHRARRWTRRWRRRRPISAPT